jgi:hypothetical protein
MRSCLPASCASRIECAGALKRKTTRACINLTAEITDFSDFFLQDIDLDCSAMLHMGNILLIQQI